MENQTVDIPMRTLPTTPTVDSRECEENDEVA